MLKRVKPSIQQKKEGKGDQLSDEAVRKIKNEIMIHDRKRLIFWISFFLISFIISIPIISSSHDDIETIMLYAIYTQVVITALIFYVSVIGNTTKLIPIVAVGYNFGEIDEFNKQRRKMFTKQGDPLVGFIFSFLLIIIYMVLKAI